MTTGLCPFCGQNTLEEKHGEYRFEPPATIPGGMLVIANATWHVCATCGEEILPHELSKAIDGERYRRLGLLTPAEIKQVRERTGLSAVDMAQLLGVGDKTYTRWENGRSLQNKSNDTLIRLIDKNAELFARLEAEREPHRDVLIGSYFRDLERLKGEHPLAMAAHGGDLSRTAFQALRRRLQEFREAQGAAT